MKYDKATKAKLLANPYTYRVTDHQLSFTADFKRNFWNSYQAGNTPRSIMKELGYDLELIGQKQLDSLVQRIKKEAESGEFSDRSVPRRRRAGVRAEEKKTEMEPTAENMGRLWNELKYLRQQVEFIKRILPTADIGGTEN